MSSILILPIGAPEPDLNIYQPLRQTRRFKYYNMVNNPNAMEVEQIANATDDMLASFEDAFSRMKMGGMKMGGKTKKHRRKSRKSKKSRKH